MALFWLMGWLAACMEKSVNWETTASLPQAFFPEATRLVPGGAVFAGYLQGGDVGAIQDARAAMFLWNGKAAFPVYDGPGWGVATLGVEGPVVWAIVGTLKPAGVDSDYRALRSLDGGASWEERGGVPGAEVSCIMAVSADEAWVLGMETLLRTTDGGQSWVTVRASGERDGVHERLERVGGRVLIIWDGVRASADGGATWLDNGVDGSQVFAVDGGTVLALFEGALSLGVMEQGGPRWLATFPAELRPFRLVVEGPRIRWLALPGGKQVGDGLRLYESTDAGKSWTTWRLPGQAKEGAADLASDGRAVFLDRRRRIHAPPAQSN